MQDKRQINDLANLARIDIDENIVDGTMKSINDILSLMDQLQSVDTVGVEAMAHPLDTYQRLRKDTITEKNQRDALQAIAPGVENSLFLVPKVID